ncbi:MAG: lipoate-protein ligase B [Cognaticolwellia sp.]|jgi:lipoate-protein ligase B
MDLGLLDYQQAWDTQKQVLAERLAGTAPDTLILVEHPPVYTLGRSRKAASHVLNPGDVPVIQVERGGDVTWHGPGQLVAYPIIALPEGHRDLHAYMHTLEAAVIATCAVFGVQAETNARNTGVWVGGESSARKLCSIGIHCRRWVTWHGLALNVAPDLSYFERIVPCGLNGVSMTSLAEELGLRFTPEMGAVKAELSAALQDLLQR